MTRKAYFNKHILLEHVLEAERIQSKTDIQPKWPEGGPLGGPLGDLPFTVKETESSTGQKWPVVQPSPGALCIRPRWLFLSDKRVLWQSWEEQTGQKKKAILLFVPPAWK